MRNRRMSRIAAIRRRPALESLERREVMSVAGLALSEVVLNPYPTQQPNQFIQIVGPANASLSGIEFVQFNGYGNGHPTGEADYIVNLSNDNLGSNGLLIIEAETGGPAVLDTRTTVVLDPNLDAGSTTGLIGGNDTTTFNALIDTTGNANVPGTDLTVGTSYDPRDHGTLTLPTNDTIVDAVSFVYRSDPFDYPDQSYAVLEPSQATQGGQITDTTLPYTDFFLPVYNSQDGEGRVPDAASRVAGDTTTPTAANKNTYNPTQHFFYGWLLSGLDFYDPNNSAGVMPPNDGALTPGGVTNTLVVETDQTSYSATPGTDLPVTVYAGNGLFPSGGLQISFETLNGTARAGVDYTAVDDILTFTNPTQTSYSPSDQVVNIPILSTATSGNFFQILLSSFGGALIGFDRNYALVTID
jgi:hypothetical protein